MMDSDSVAIFLPEESERKRQSCRPGRRFFCILAVVAFFTLTILFGVTLGLSVNNANNYEWLRSEYDRLDTNQDEEDNNTASNLAMIDKKINESEFNWRLKINGRFNAVDNNLRTQGKHNRNYRSYANSSLENITTYLNNLNSTVDRLILSVSKVNASSDVKIKNLRKTLKGIEGDLGQTRTALKRVNGSVREDVTQVSKSFSVAVNDLKKALNSLKSSSRKRIEELWDNLNKTDTEFKQSLERMSQQNTTFHLVIEYNSNALSSGINKVRKNLTQLIQDNVVAMGEDKVYLQKELNNTRHSLKEQFRSETSRSESSLTSKIESLDKQFNSSLANVKTRIDAAKNQFETSVKSLRDEQTSTKDELSKTKLSLQGVDDKIKTNISALIAKIGNIKTMYAKLGDDLNDEQIKRQKVEKGLQELRGIVDKLQNKANRTWGVHTNLIAFLISIIYLNT